MSSVIKDHFINYVCALNSDLQKHNDIKSHLDKRYVKKEILKVYTYMTIQ